MRHVHWRRLLWITAGILLAGLLGAAAGSVVLLSGAYNTAATRQHYAVTHWVLERGLKFSVAQAANELRVPAFRAAEARTIGAACFREHCVQCHGAPGVAPGGYATGMLPLPASLLQAADDWTRAELFWIVSKGIRMTGMPAWEYRLAEDSRWSLVAFLEVLPGLTPADYQRLGALDASCPPASGFGDTLPEPRADPREVALRQYGCIGCHRIGGVVGPPVQVGPPLEDWARRKFIAGTLPNTPANLARWIQAPDELVPGTAMPDLGVTPAHARAMASYLFEPSAAATPDVLPP